MSVGLIIIFDSLILLNGKEKKVEINLELVILKERRLDPIRKVSFAPRQRLARNLHFLTNKSCNFEAVLCNTHPITGHSLSLSYVEISVFLYVN